MRSRQGRASQADPASVPPRDELACAPEIGAVTLDMGAIESPDSGVARWRGRRPAFFASLAVPPLAYLAGSVYVYGRVLADPAHRVIGGADTELFAWYFAWYRHALTLGHNPFISHAINVPSGVNVMWNNAMPPLAVLSMPFVATFGALATVTVLTALSPALSATSAYFALRHVSGRTIGAVIGAVLFGFGPYFVGHQGHLPLIFLPLVPMILLVAYQLLVRQDKPVVRTGLLLGVLIAAQLLLEEEVLAIVMVTLLIGVAFGASIYPREVRCRARHAATGLGIAAVISLVICAVPLYYQFFGAYRPTKRFAQTTLAKADVASLVRPSLLLHYSTHASRRANIAFPANGAENTGYLGWPLIIAGLVVCGWLIVRKRRLALWWLLSAAVIVMFSFGTPIVVDGRKLWHGPWAVAHTLPLLSGLLPVRLSLITLALFACLIACVLATLRGRALVVGIAVACACLVPLRPVAPYRAAEVAATPRFFTTSAAFDQVPSGANVLVMPIPGVPKINAMVWQAEAGIPFNIVGGYSLLAAPRTSLGWSYFPDVPSFARALAQLGRDHGTMTAADAASLRPSLLSSKVQYILITTQQPGSAAVAAAAAQLTGCRPRAVSDVVVCAVRRAGAG